MPSTATDRFLGVIDNLVKSGKVKNAKDLIQKSGMPNSTITEIKQGRSKVTLPIIQKLVSAFPNEVDMNYIIQGVSEPVDEKINQENAPIQGIDILSKAVELLSKSTEILERQLVIVNNDKDYLKTELHNANQLIAEYVVKATPMIMNEKQFQDHIDSHPKSKIGLKKRRAA